MLKELVLNFIGKCAKWTFNYSFAGCCTFLFYQEELPKEAFEAEKV